MSFPEPSPRHATLAVQSKPYEKPDDKPYELAAMSINPINPTQKIQHFNYNSHA